MTAAVLQFNPMHIRKLNDQHLQQQEEDIINVSFDNAYRDRMVALLNTEHPFRAVRLAEEFNRENGFELIDKGIIRKWRKEIMKNGKSNCQNSQIKSQNMKIPKSNCEKSQIDFYRNKNSEIKLQQLEAGYIELSSAQNHYIGTIVT